MTLEGFLLIVALLAICAMATAGSNTIDMDETRTKLGVLIRALLVIVLFIIMVWSFFGAVWLVFLAWRGAL